MVQVRQATKKDSKSILDLLVQLRPKPHTKIQRNLFLRTIQKYISDRDKKILVAIQDSKIVGLASLVFIPRLNQKLELWIPELVVDENRRRKGVGNLLINSAIVLAEKNGCFRIRLESGNKRKGSHKFYEKLGFDQYALSFKKKIT